MSTYDPETGRLNFAITIDVHLVDQAVPLIISARDWKAARAWLASPEFRRMADRVEFITLTNNEFGQGAP